MFIIALCISVSIENHLSQMMPGHNEYKEEKTDSYSQGHLGSNMIKCSAISVPPNPHRGLQSMQLRLNLTLLKYFIFSQMKVSENLISSMNGRCRQNLPQGTRFLLICIHCAMLLSLTGTKQYAN